MPLQLPPIEKCHCNLRKLKVAAAFFKYKEAVVAFI
jgi:hypothetical protein